MGIGRLIVRALVASAVVAGIAVPGEAWAAGMTTHSFMADRAIEHVETSELKTLLALHRQSVLSGGAFPDSGYFPGTGYGETAHWERFINEYVDRLRLHARPVTEGGRGCDLHDPYGACAPLVAHLMGAAAHGMGDETWDWLFEPRAKDHGEEPANPCFNDRDHTHPDGCPVNLHHFDGTPPDDLSSSIEYAMDIQSIFERGRWLGNSPLPPPVDDLMPVFAAAGESNGTADKIVAGHGIVTAALAAERAVSPVETSRIRRQMPWSSDHFVEEPGGVDWSARAIAGYYEAVWAKLGGEWPDPKVVALHPRKNERGVTTSWPPGQTSPGMHTGGGENRIIAVLSNAVYPPSVNAQTFRLLDENGAEVAPAPGFPRVGPYGGQDGTHSLMFYPASDLEPCTTYTAVLSTGIRDWRGVGGPIGALPREHSWSFETEPAAGASGPPGNPCHVPPGRAKTR